jgi:uncharacterized protein with gpF-like domain
MCVACGHRTHALAKDSDTERAAREAFLDELVRILGEWHDDVLAALREGRLRLAADEAARRTVARVLTEYRDPIDTTTTTAWRDGAAAGRAATVRRYDLDVPVGEDALADRVRRELQDYALQQADQFTGRMVVDVAAALRDAHDAGIGVPEMERILAEEVFPDMTSYEAERIARTAGTGAAARGAVSSIRDAGAPGKEWLAEDDSRTRAAHNAADGQVVPVGSKFTVGGQRLWWPGDPRGGPENVINCRCGVAPVWDL